MVEVGQDSPAAEELSSSHAPAGAEGPGTLLLGGHVDHEVHHPVAVAKFIVVPGNELDKVVVEGNASPSIEGRRVSVAVEVAGDNLGEERASYGTLPGSQGPCRHQSPDPLTVPGPQCSLECP